jgi:hypothetical protein
MPPDAVMRVMTESGFRDVACVNHFDLFQYYTGRKAED